MLAQLAKPTDASVFFPETPAASRAEQQPTPGRLPLPSQRGVSVPGQDAARRELGYGESLCQKKKKEADRLRASVGTRRATLQKCWHKPTLEEHLWYRKWQSHTSAEMKYLCFAGKIIKSVPSKLIKEVRNALLCVCFTCRCVFFWQLDIFDHRTVKVLSQPDPVFTFVVLFFSNLVVSPSERAAPGAVHPVLLQLLRIPQTQTQPPGTHNPQPHLGKR